jgi:hypothetical protein
LKKVLIFLILLFINTVLADSGTMVVDLHLQAEDIGSCRLTTIETQCGLAQIVELTNDNNNVCSDSTIIADGICPELFCSEVNLTYTTCEKGIIVNHEINRGQINYLGPGDHCDIALTEQPILSFNNNGARIWFEPEDCAARNMGDDNNTQVPEFTSFGALLGLLGIGIIFVIKRK